ncbi:hypothetical protein [Pueribacillus sp. YX66]|uniref:hypothetical protein n=1 Tax=Pueribacillus sp. YX66 TaxID=3229242 RepID=UPI00358D4B79
MFEQMINFFFQNMFFFIILLFGLSQLFRRKTSSESSGRENRPQTKGSPLPPVAKPFFEEWLEPQKYSEKAQVHEEEEANEVENVSTSMGQEKHQTYSPPLQLASEANMSFPKREDSLQYEDEVKIKTTTFQNPSRREVAHGIIWAEILGPPRAKKKYTYRRY